jgi:pimeloyl-ACP methyl ester carboxylesterase
MPTFFVAGSLDPVIHGRDDYLARMDSDLADHRATVLIPGAGHWVQQEAPGEFNRALLDFISRSV